MDVIKFMLDNNIAIFVEVDVNDKLIYMRKRDIEMQSYDLFEQLILYNSIDNLIQNVSGQLLPRIWGQGDTQCVICKPNDTKLICLFYDKHLDAKENYFYAEELSIKINAIY